MSVNPNRVHGPIPGLDYLSGEIPDELVEMIARLVVDHQIPSSRTQRSNVASLGAFARTCRRLHQLVEPILYKENARTSSLIIVEGDPDVCSLTTGFAKSTIEEDGFTEPEESDGDESQHFDVKVLKLHTFPALSWGAFHNSLGTMRRALAYGANVNAPGRHPDCLGGRVTKRSRDNMEDQQIQHPGRAIGCAIHFAAFQGHDEAVAFLLEHGASLEIGSVALCECSPVTMLHTNRKVSDGNYYHWLPLHHAICRGRESTTKLLLDRNAPLEMYTERGKESALPVVLAASDSNEKAKPEFGHRVSAMQVAAAYGMSGILETIQMRWTEGHEDAGSCTAAQSELWNGGWNLALNYAIRSWNSNAETIRILVRLGAQPKDHLLLFAAQLGNWEAAIGLLDAGADVFGSDRVRWEGEAKDEKYHLSLALHAVLNIKGMAAPEELGQSRAWRAGGAEFFEKAFLPHRESLWFDSRVAAGEREEGWTVLTHACAKLLEGEEAEDMAGIIRFVAGESLRPFGDIEQQHGITKLCPLQILLNHYIELCFNVLDRDPELELYDWTPGKAASVLRLIRELIEFLLQMGAKADKLGEEREKDGDGKLLKTPLRCVLDFVEFPHPRLKVQGLRLLRSFRKYGASSFHYPESIGHVERSIRRTITELRQPSVILRVRDCCVDNPCPGRYDSDDDDDEEDEDSEYGADDDECVCGYCWVEWIAFYDPPEHFPDEHEFKEYLRTINCNFPWFG